MSCFGCALFAITWRARTCLRIAPGSCALCLHLWTKLPTLTHTLGAASTIYRRLDLTTPQGAAKYWGDVNNSVCVP